MGYNINKEFNNGVTCKYANIAGYKVNKLNNTITIDIGYYISKTTRTNTSKVYSSESIFLALPDLNASKDITSTLYFELNKINPFKDMEVD